MSVATTTVPVKFHLSLNVASLDKSIAFYRLLFGCEPAKCRPDYAKFETDDPPLVLSLEPHPPKAGGALNHLGLRVGSAEALVETQRRLETAGLATQREEGVECCYARQTKFWAHDPDGNLWELYILLEDIEHRGAGQTLEQMHPGGLPEAAEPVAAPEVWTHTLGMPLPMPIDQTDSSVDQVHLLGTFNAAMPDEARDRLLAEACRILRPGGELMLHTLVADRAFPSGMPRLPGPAARVETAPIDEPLFAAVERAGFVGLRLDKFDAAPCFTIDGVAMRESKLRANRPAEPSSESESFVLYRGPHKQVVDELGNVYPRGVRVRVGSAAVAALKLSPQSDRFVIFASPQVVSLR